MDNNLNFSKKKQSSGVSFLQEELEFPQSTEPLKKSFTDFYIRATPLKKTKVFDTYWKFAVERQNIFFNKQKEKCTCLTNDPILSTYKFTNAYRSSDRVSQYLIKNVIYKGDQSPDEVFFRTILFKTFNKIETWELLLSHLNDISYSNYSFERYDTILSEAMAVKTAIYSAAYIMTSGKSEFGYSRKHQNHLKLIERMMIDNLPKQITGLQSLKALFELLKSYPTIGDFLAYQYAIDINYSNLVDFSEMEFIVAGPGAINGINKCFSEFGTWSYSDIIRYVTENQEKEFKRLGLDFKDLWGRSLQLIDCQNLFCETDKYSRVAHPEITGGSNRKRIKQKYNAKNKKITYWYPPKWGINNKIHKEIY